MGKPAFAKMVWNTQIVQDQLKRNDKYGPLPFKWIFDGNKLAWSRNNVPEIRIKVDMDEQKSTLR